MTRSIVTRFLGAASAFALAAALLAPLAPQAQAQGRRMVQGGSGPIQVLLVTKGHAYDRENFFNLFDALGETITWTHVEQPAAQAFWDPKMAEQFDVFVYFDAMGRREMKLADGTTGFEVAAERVIPVGIAAACRLEVLGLGDEVGAQQRVD